MGSQAVRRKTETEIENKKPSLGLPLVVLPDSALHTEPRPSLGTPVVLWPERPPPPALNKRDRASALGLLLCLCVFPFFLLPLLAWPVQAFCYYVDCRTRGASFLESNVTGTTNAVAPGFVSMVCARHERTITMDAAPSDAESKAQRIKVTSPPGAGETG